MAPLANSIESLLRLFNLEKKREVEKYCRDLIIRSEDFADVILAARAGSFNPYQYGCHFAELAPEHLNPTDSDLRALATNGVGLLKADARKAVSKMNQMFEDRRMLSAHLFYSSSHRYWHLFYFDQRDVSARKSHWEHGPHIHYTRECFTRFPLVDVWSHVNASSPRFQKSIHIRYDYHHNRRRVAA